MPEDAACTFPCRLWVVRHGQSAGNVALARAEESGASLIDIEGRDMDVPLSPLGERQAAALGRWFAAMPADERPTVVLASPYRRAVETATRSALANAGPKEERSPTLVLDERLREKELGVLDRFTRTGILERFPEEAERRGRIGKLYYRPPGGESWCDVILRLRSLIDHVRLQYRGERVLIVAHQVIVLCLRYLIEELDETSLLAIDREKDVANCGVTAYLRDFDEAGRERLRLEVYNFVAPLEEAGTPVTQAPDRKAVAP